MLALDRLLDFRGKKDSLIEDRDNAYDLPSVNGRLLLRLKEPMSELQTIGE